METTQEKIAKILQESHEKMGYSFEFPQYKILPDEVQLAVKVLKNHGMKILFTLTPDEETK